jgi:hypothetical protein
LIDDDDKKTDMLPCFRSLFFDEKLLEKSSIIRSHPRLVVVIFVSSKTTHHGDAAHASKTDYSVNRFYSVLLLMFLESVAITNNGNYLKTADKHYTLARAGRSH